MKQPFRARHGHQRGHLPATTRLPEDRHRVRIAAEMSDVLAYPVQCRDYVQHPDGSGKRELRSGDLTEVSRAQHIQPVIDADNHNIVLMGQIDAVIYRTGAGPGGEAPSMQPDHDRPLGPATYFRS